MITSLNAPVKNSTTIGAPRAMKELRNQERKKQRLHKGIRPILGSPALAQAQSSDFGSSARVNATKTSKEDQPVSSPFLQAVHHPPGPSQGTQHHEGGWKHHKKQSSNASSGFVHTVKTASLSNASFSLLPLSLRIGRSTDSSVTFGSHLRRSIDSDRPATTSSLDEAAYRRAIKRSQILGELISTEEGYVADLKALIYLYSTLLATTMTIPSRVRSSIQRNVHNLLHTHESLLDQLHQTAYESAARKWADTKFPQHLGSPHRHGRWRSLESHVVFKIGRAHRQTRSSVGSPDIVPGSSQLGAAEPRDISEIATIFKEFLNDFYAYEEYCANHSLIAHELQKHAPILWSTYESGLESLAKSLVALDNRQEGERKGLTVGDLLIKPIQRLTKYPLLFEDLLKHTPVADCPSAHTVIEATVQGLRDVVHTVNEATDNSEARAQAHRRWSLQSRLNYDSVSLQPENLRFLGDVKLCGVLHVTWQTKAKIEGSYAVCILLDTGLIVALPMGSTLRLDIIAFLQLSDIKLGSASDGRGLQCHSTHHTWKVGFEVDGHLNEFIMSACSAVEENTWMEGLAGKYSIARDIEVSTKHLQSSVGMELRSVGMVYSPQVALLGRNPSVQRAATVGNRANICQVIIRNTHNPHGLHEYRQSSSINRSQSHMTSNRIVVLSPKKSERARLESTLADVWTKDKLPYPGMSGSRGGQIIRASAGSLARKLSLASIHAPFSRRGGSISVVSRKSYDIATEGRQSRRKRSAPVFEVRKESLEETPTTKKKSHDVPEVDTMDSVISRMIGNSGSKKTCSTQSAHKFSRGERRRQIPVQAPHEVGPEDPADIFYSDEKDKIEKDELVEEGLVGRKKRWSNPIGRLKGLSTEGLRHMLYSSK